MCVFVCVWQASYSGQVGWDCGVESRMFKQSGPVYMCVHYER